MPDKAPLYRIDESLLRSKLLGYEVQLNSSHCDAIEQEVANIRFKKSITLPKVNPRILVAVLLIAGLTTLICFNLENIKDLFSPAPETKTIQTTIATEPAKPVVNTNTQTAVTNSPVPTPTVSNIPPPVQHFVPKKDTVTIAKKADTIKPDNAKKPNPVMAQPPSDSAAKVNAVNKQDTAVKNGEQPVRKKKKRRRRNSSNMDELKQSTLENSGSDEDVVVPQ